MTEMRVLLLTFYHNFNENIVLLVTIFKLESSIS